MRRKAFIKSGLFSLGSIVGIPVMISSCSKDNSSESENTNCNSSPAETKGPYPIKTPSQLVIENIKSDRTGIALLINLTIKGVSNNCLPLDGLLVDVWHCDKDGNYSEYGGNAIQPTDYSAVHFLRGRQTTNGSGQVSFISIYPGWYSGRAPHIHVEILSKTGQSIHVTQIAFPENISAQVYASPLYTGRGLPNTSNSRDDVFSDSLDQQMASMTGNLVDGFTLTQTIVVNA